MSLKLGPVRVDVHTMDGKLVYSGQATEATISTDRSECSLSLATNSRVSHALLLPREDSGASMAAHRADQQGAGR